MNFADKAGDPSPVTLREVYGHQPTRERELGMAFEILGYVSRQELRRSHSGYTFSWDGMDAYSGGEPSSKADFVDTYCNHTITDEYKNTSGSYYLTQYVKDIKYDNYTIAAIKGGDSAKDLLETKKKSCLITGVQIDEFPLTTHGEVKKKFRGVVRIIKAALWGRITMGALGESRGASNTSEGKVSLLGQRGSLWSLRNTLFHIDRTLYLLDRQNPYIRRGSIYRVGRSMITRITVGVSIPVSLVGRLDSMRGSTPRSRLIVKLVEEGLSRVEGQTNISQSVASSAESAPNSTGDGGP